MEVKLKAPNPPIIAEETIIKFKKLELNIDKRNIGATFCQVIRIKIWNQKHSSTIFGNQKCRGGTPAFNVNLKKIISEKNIISSKYEFMNIIILKIIIITDAAAWIKKYLIVDSEEMGDNLMVNMGIKHIKLISKPIQQVSHELAEHVIIVPIIIININIIKFILIIIKEKLVFHKWGMSPIA